VEIALPNRIDQVTDWPVDGRRRSHKATLSPQGAHWRATPNAKTARHHPRSGRLLARRGGCWPSDGPPSALSPLSRAPNGQPSNPKHLLAIPHAAAIFTPSTPDTAKPASNRSAALIQWLSHGHGNRVLSDGARVGLYRLSPQNAGALWRERESGPTGGEGRNKPHQFDNLVVEIQRLIPTTWNAASACRWTGFDSERPAPLALGQAVKSAISSAPEFCTENALIFQWLGFGTKFLIFARRAGCRLSGGRQGEASDRH
jgi:hypothetical protein